MQTRSYGLQLLSGVILPWTLAAAGSYATIVKGNYAKDVTSVGGWFKWMRTMGSKSKNILLVSAALQLAWDAVIVSRMQSEWNHVASSIQEMYEKGELKENQ